MALKRNAWAAKKTPSVCITATGIVFATFLLVGVWLLSSSSQIPRAEVLSSEAETAGIIDGKILSVGEVSGENTDSGLPGERSRDVTDSKGILKPSQSDEDSWDDTEETSHQNGGDEGVSDQRNNESEMKEKKPEDTVKEQKNENSPDVKVESKSQDTVKDETIESSEELPTASQSELTSENKEATSTWSTQEKESKSKSSHEVNKNAPFPMSIEQTSQTDQPKVGNEANNPSGGSSKENEKQKSSQNGHEQFTWKLCNWDGAADYIPCLDNKEAIKMLPTTIHYEHRERHCPTGNLTPTCLIPLPTGYKVPIHWPESRDRVWYDNVPHPGLVSYKKGQNWVRKKGNLFYFPGGGTQFKQGANQYINFIEETLPAIEWGKRTRVILDVGCGVASFGGFLFDRNVLTMSFAPKDEHEAQVQLALERGIPAFLSVMGTQRLVFSSNSFDLVHCSRCRVPWHVDGGKLLLELNRVLRPGGYFVWSATPVYLNEQEDKEIWKATTDLATSMCWTLLTRKNDHHTGIGVAIFQKPLENSCYEQRQGEYPPMCDDEDNPDAAWYVPMKNCIHKIQSKAGERSSTWPENWPARLQVAPKWLSSMPKGLFGRPATEEFADDTQHWKRVIENSYLRGLGMDWDTVRNIMDMKAGYGGFAAALEGHPVWVMNVIPTSEPDTLPIILDRGLFGLYHDWCESFSTYPRTYDLLHADHVFAKVQQRCNMQHLIIEMDRILRPGGWAILRETTIIVGQIESIVKSLHWDTRLSYVQDQEQLLVLQKGFWRPDSKS